VLAAGAAGLVMPLLPVAASTAGGNATCSGGSVAAGTSQSIPTAQLYQQARPASDPLWARVDKLAGNPR